MRITHLLLFVLVSIASAFGQSPFIGLGRSTQLLTLTGQSYPEVFLHDSIVQIGSLLFDTRSKCVVAFVERDPGCSIGLDGDAKEDEIHGATGTSYDFRARLLYTRVGRWWSVDPLATKAPDASPYAFAINSPIMMYDEGGKIFRIYYEIYNETTGKTVLTYADFDGTKAVTKDGQEYTMGTNQFVDDVITSYNYIVANGADVNNVLPTLAKDKTITDVVLEKKHITQYDGRETIMYNPISGLDINQRGEKGIQSAAMGFFHEAVHRFIKLKYTAQQKKAMGDEELHIIYEYEHPAIDKLREKQLSETKRFTHGHGLDVFTEGPSSTTPAEDKKAAKESLNTRNVTMIKD